MKSSEQIGRSSKQPKQESRKNKEETPEEPERRITTPEEAAEMTQQRREYFGLGEARKLTPKENEELERNIKELLGDLNEYNFKNYSPEIREYWYWAETEAIAGKDRELAEANLEKLLKVLQKEAEKTEK